MTHDCSEESTAIRCLDHLLSLLLNVETRSTFSVLTTKSEQTIYSEVTIDTATALIGPVYRIMAFMQAGHDWHENEAYCSVHTCDVVIPFGGSCRFTTGLSRQQS